MKQAIIKALEALNIANFSITQTNQSTAELFFIKKQLDMRRIKDTQEYSVTIYNDFEEGGQKFRGSSTLQLFPGTDEAAIMNSLRDAYNAAGYVKNKYYELYVGSKEAEAEMPSTLSAYSLNDAAKLMADALFAEDRRKDAWLNSAELFIKRTRVAITTSAGTDVAFIKHGCSGEFVAQAKQPQDVEQYFSFSYDELDTAALSEKVRRALDTVCDRAHAQDCPAGGAYDIVLSGEHVATLMQFYLNRAHASLVYPHYSDWQKGTAAQGELDGGEAIDLTLVPSAPYSAEGIPMRELELIKQGYVQRIYGATRFCRYLGIEPTGDYARMRLDCGSIELEKMKQGCLYPVSFSDFQMDAMTGHFGGEIRLAYLYTENGVKLLTGGSINGSILDKQGKLIFSKERFSNSYYEGPFAVRIAGVNVSGK